MEMSGTAHILIQYTFLIVALVGSFITITKIVINYMVNYVNQAVKVLAENLSKVETKVEDQEEKDEMLQNNLTHLSTDLSKLAKLQYLLIQTILSEKNVETNPLAVKILQQLEKELEDM